MIAVVSPLFSEQDLLSIKKTFQAYEGKHPGAQIELYRRNSISVRIRVVDPTFAKMEISDRHAKVWEYLGELPEDVLGDISMLVLLAPGEARMSIANLEFEDPSPSLIQ